MTALVEDEEDVPNDLIASCMWEAALLFEISRNGVVE